MFPSSHPSHQEATYKPMFEARESNRSSPLEGSATKDGSRSSLCVNYTSSGDAVLFYHALPTPVETPPV